LKNGPVWYARFYNPETEKYDIYRSTGIPNTGRKGKRDEAYKIATGLLETVRPNRADPLFLEYILAFWTIGSPYLKTKELSDQQPLSKDYIEQNFQGIKLHVATYKRFETLHLSQLKISILEDWKLHVLENGIGQRRFNAVLQSIRVPIRYALQREEIASDPFLHVKSVKYVSREKGIISKQELVNLLAVKDHDPRVTLATFLGVLCGLRRGEARGLLWGDIDLTKMLIQVQNNYVDKDGKKPCKCGSNRIVVLPKQLISILNIVKTNSPYTEKNDYVLFGEKTRDKPVTNATLRGGFSRMLITSGLNEKEYKKRNLTYHGYRHTFVTFARLSGLPDIIVQALAGHKSSEMMDHYSHGAQAMDFDQARKIFEGMENIKQSI